MRVCLVSPPTLTEFNERRIGEREAYRLVAEYAPLGILSLAAVLERGGTTPHVLDLNPTYYDYARSGGEQFAFFAHVVGLLAAVPCDVFGLGTICSSYPLTLRVARELKRLRPEAAIVLGGPQASVVDVETLKEFPFVDFVLRGESETTLPQLLDAVSSGGAGVEQVRGLTYRGGGGVVVRNPNAPVIEDLDALPLPAFHLDPYLPNCRTFPLEAGRGCPFACAFCSTNDFFRRRFRMKSPHALVGQMRLIKQTYGVDSFDLIHDMFTVDRRKVLAFCAAVEESGERFRWGCSARTDCLDDETLDAMARAGCDRVFFGIDAGSERMQEALDKGLDMREAATRVARADRRGLRTVVSLITGFPEETEEDMRATVRFFGESLRHKKAEVQFHLLAPLARTPVTTRHQGQLVYDEIFSDMSFQGWEQDPEDRALILAHRDIFTNFYAVPTRLDRRRLVELREFLLHGVARHRGLMAFLHRWSGDLSRVFDEWKDWPGAAAGEPEVRGARDRYKSRRFTDDLLAFVRTRGVEVWGGGHLASTMADVESALRALKQARPEGVRVRRGAPRSLPAESVPAVAEGVRLIRVSADYKRLVRCVAGRGRLESIPAEPVTLLLAKTGAGVKILQPDPTTLRLLGLCDGSRSLPEVVGSFAREGGFGGVPAEKVGLYGVLALARRGLLDIRPAAAGARPRPDLSPVPETMRGAL
jgi:radical SAM superfamily enzyme YgiQ (UPF0313 family)